MSEPFKDPDVEVERLQSENERLRERVEELLWDVLHDCRVTMTGWYRPATKRQEEACRELERMGKLDKHPDKDWWRKKGGA